MGVPAESAHELVDLLMHHGVVGHMVREVLVLLGGGQLAMEDQVGHLEEVALGGQVLDRVAPVQQDALVAVDEGDLGAAGGRGGEARVVGEHARLGVEPADVDDVGAQAAAEHRQLGVTVVPAREAHGLRLAVLAHCGAPVRLTARSRLQHARGAI